jgi:predicted RNase H-like nuclease
MVTVTGVDGCRAGWLALTRRLETGELTHNVYESAGQLLVHRREDTVIAVDIPIGLPNDGWRQCDRKAREVLGDRRNSVFEPPARMLLAAASHAEASEMSRRTFGKGLSIQSYCLFRKIDNIDRAVLGLRPEDRLRIREVHPEVSFWAWNGNVPLKWPKKRREGREERERLVVSYFGSSDLEVIRSTYRRRDVGNDDILDAFAALWTAERIARGEARTLPDNPPRDSLGLTMEMVY